MCWCIRRDCGYYYKRFRANNHLDQVFIPWGALIYPVSEKQGSESEQYKNPQELEGTNNRYRFHIPVHIPDTKDATYESWSQQFEAAIGNAVKYLSVCIIAAKAEQDAWHKIYKAYWKWGR